MAGYRDRNRRAWDRFARTGSTFAKVATDDECREPLKTLDGRGWLPSDVTGLRVLCLAAGGGWQSILYASAGAEVTVVDISAEMLALDHREADRRGLSVRVVEAGMDDLPMLRDAEFDLVHQPVSTCYVSRIAAVYREIARVLRPGGLFISQHKQPASLQATHRNEHNLYVLGIEYYRDTALPAVDDTAYREEGADEFLHRWEELIGGLCRSGFVIEDLSEPYRADPKAAIGHFRYRGRFLPPYVRIKARRLAEEPANTRAKLWTPGG